MPHHSLLRLGTVLAALSSSAFATVYDLGDTYAGSTFLDGFDFFTEADPNHGFVRYMDRTSATNARLVREIGSQTYLGVDFTTPLSINAPGRPSVRIESKARYQEGLFILDLAHMPSSTCGVWSAFWTLGANDAASWPSNGEIDIIEGVNLNSRNKMVLHTDTDCKTDGMGQTGVQNLYDCALDSPSGTSGCDVDANSPNSFGSGFNAISGGVYAMEWTSTAIKIWFFPRGSIPSSISSDQPDTAQFGIPLANFKGDCDIRSRFVDHKFIFNTNFCGDWAGNAYAGSGCPQYAGLSGMDSCKRFVAQNPSAFSQSYWLINYFKTFSIPKVTSSSSSSSVASSTSSVASSSSVVSTTSTVVSSSSTSEALTSTSSEASSTDASTSSDIASSTTSSDVASTTSSDIIDSSSIASSTSTDSLSSSSSTTSSATISDVSSTTSEASSTTSEASSTTSEASSTTSEASSTISEVSSTISDISSSSSSTIASDASSSSLSSIASDTGSSSEAFSTSDASSSSFVYPTETSEPIYPTGNSSTVIDSSTSSSTSVAASSTGYPSYENSTVHYPSAPASSLVYIDYPESSTAEYPAITPSAGHLTSSQLVYTTTYVDVCSTGFTTVSTTMTAIYTKPTGTVVQPKEYPEGFTTTVKYCAIGCAAGPTSVTVTVPCTETPYNAAPSHPAGEYEVDSTPAGPEHAYPTSFDSENSDDKYPASGDYPAAGELNPSQPSKEYPTEEETNPSPPSKEYPTEEEENPSQPSKEYPTEEETETTHITATHVLTLSVVPVPASEYYASASSSAGSPAQEYPEDSRPSAGYPAYPASNATVGYGSGTGVGAVPSKTSYDEPPYFTGGAAATLKGGVLAGAIAAVFALVL